MKVQARIEKELFRAIDNTEKTKKEHHSAEILQNAERIKVLTWVLSDLDEDLDYFISKHKKWI